MAKSQVGTGVKRVGRKGEKSLCSDASAEISADARDGGSRDSAVALSWPVGVLLVGRVGWIIRATARRVGRYAVGVGW